MRSGLCPTSRTGGIAGGGREGEAIERAFAQLLGALSGNVDEQEPLHVRD